MSQRKLCLIGGMGSGKSSLSRRYSALVGGTAVDTDKEFTRRYGEISGFFEKYGEKEFRKREQQIMIEAAASSACVIATGGGAVLNKRGMCALRKECDIVWLTAPTDVLKRRIQNSDRPLKHNLDRIMNERTPLYRHYADYVIDSSDDSLRELMSALCSPRKLRYDVVLCDADETLLDFSKAYAWSIENTFKHMGFTVDMAQVVEEYDKINAQLWGRLERGDISRKELKTARAKMLGAALNIQFDPDVYNEIYVGLMQKTRFTLDGAMRFCDGLREKGAKCYIVTNSFEEIARERLKALVGHIDGYFISQAVGYDKPDRRYFDAVLERLGEHDKSRIIIFGDGESSDIAGGVNSGIDTCLYDRTGSKTYADTAADYIAWTYDEFLKVL